MAEQIKGRAAIGEQTLVLLKPDSVSMGNIGSILSLYERTGLSICAMQMMWPTNALLEEHYAEHAGKSFLPELIDFMMSGPVVAAVLCGTDAVVRVRALNGATNPENAEPGTVRQQFGTDTRRNSVHGSAVAEDAEREIALWFPERK